MIEQHTEAYEPPAIAPAGDFADVTLGRAGWGWDAWNECYFWCDRP